MLPSFGERMKARNKTKRMNHQRLSDFARPTSSTSAKRTAKNFPTIGSVNGDPREYRERLAKFVAEQGIALEYSEDIAPARGTSAGGKITLLPGQSPAEEFATLAHELAHEMMHRDERRSSTSKRSRETEAEAVAFVVCHAIGLETGSASQDYIQLYEGDAKLLTASLEHIQKTATQILNAIGAEGPSAPPA